MFVLFVLYAVEAINLTNLKKFTTISDSTELESMVEDVYKCKNYTEWIIYAGILTVLSVLILIKHESIATILRPIIPWFIWWGRKILSRSEEEISSNEEAN